MILYVKKLLSWEYINDLIGVMKMCYKTVRQKIEEQKLSVGERTTEELKDRVQEAMLLLEELRKQPKSVSTPNLLRELRIIRKGCADE